MSKFLRGFVNRSWESPFHKLQSSFFAPCVAVPGPQNLKDNVAVASSVPQEQFSERIREQFVDSLVHFLFMGQSVSQIVQKKTFRW